MDKTTCILIANDDQACFYDSLQGETRLRDVTMPDGETTREQFAQDLISRLACDAEEDRFESLIIVARPAMLRALQDHETLTLRDRLIAAIPCLTPNQWLAVS